MTELGVRTAFVDFDHDATIDANALTNFQYVSKGGFALVFVANYCRSDGVVQPVAVKVLKPENHFRPPSYSKFLQEAAFQTALTHPSIVHAIGFCSIPAARLIAAAPPAVLLPPDAVGTAASAAAAAPATAWNGNSKSKSHATSKKPMEGGSVSAAVASWFEERRLVKCWALVLELMSEGNLYDQVHGASIAAAAASSRTSSRTTSSSSLSPPPPPAVPSGAPGRYSDAQALAWLIELCEAMTYLHSRQPLLIHRDLKLENVLLRREADGQLHAKLSDFGLMVAVDGCRTKQPPPQILRAPGQSLADASPPTIPPSNRKPQQNVRQLQRLPQQQQGTAAAAPGRAAEDAAQQNAIENEEAVEGASTLCGGMDGAPLRPQRSVHSWSEVTRPTVDRSRYASGQGAVRPNGVVKAAVAENATAVQNGARQHQNMSQQQLQQQQGDEGAGLGGAGSRGLLWGGWGRKPRGPDVHSGGSRPQIEPRKPSHQNPQSLKEGEKGGGVAAATAAAGMGAAAQDASPCMPCSGGGGGVTPPSPAGPQSQLSRVSSTSSCSRMSATGHSEVTMSQLAGLQRLGLGHRDYLPDMYQLTFKLTTQCGSVCYMAPEVARQRPYNQKADVFSFGCILFELLTRSLLSDSIPEGDVDAAMEYLGRVAWSGWRPELPQRIPKELRLLISLTWHREPRLRPSFPTIASRLRDVLFAAACPCVSPPAGGCHQPLLLQGHRHAALQEGLQQTKSAGCLVGMSGGAEATARIQQRQQQQQQHLQQQQQLQRQQQQLSEPSGAPQQPYLHALMQQHQTTTQQQQPQQQHVLQHVPQQEQEEPARRLLANPAQDIQIQPNKLASYVSQYHQLSPYSQPPSLHHPHDQQYAQWQLQLHQHQEQQLDEAMIQLDRSLHGQTQTGAPAPGPLRLLPLVPPPSHSTVSSSQSAPPPSSSSSSHALAPSPAQPTQPGRSQVPPLLACSEYPADNHSQSTHKQLVLSPPASPATRSARSASLRVSQAANLFLNPAPHSPIVFTTTTTSSQRPHSAITPAYPLPGPVLPQPEVHSPSVHSRPHPHGLAGAYGGVVSQPRPQSHNIIPSKMVTTLQDVVALAQSSHSSAQTHLSTHPDRYDQQQPHLNQQELPLQQQQLQFQLEMINACTKRANFVGAVPTQDMVQQFQMRVTGRPGAVSANNMLALVPVSPLPSPLDNGVNGGGMTSDVSCSAAAATASTLCTPYTTTPGYRMSSPILGTMAVGTTVCISTAAGLVPMYSSVRRSAEAQLGVGSSTPRYTTATTLLSDSGAGDYLPLPSPVSFRGGKGAGGTMPGVSGAGVSGERMRVSGVVEGGRYGGVSRSEGSMCTAAAGTASSGLSYKSGRPPSAGELNGKLPQALQQPDGCSSLCGVM